MSKLFLVIIIGLLVNVIIAMFVVNFLRVNNKVLGIITGFTAGIMLSIGLLEILPDSIRNIGLLSTLLATIMGILIMYLVNVILESINCNRHINSALIIFLGLVIHKVPEGMIIGMALLNGSVEGVKIIIIILLHGILETAALSAPLIVSGSNNKKVFSYVFFTIFSTFIGVIIGVLFESNKFIGLSLSISIGVILFIVFKEMLEEAGNLIGLKFTYVFLAVGLIVGSIVI